MEDRRTEVTRGCQKLSIKTGREGIGYLGGGTGLAKDLGEHNHHRGLRVSMTIWLAETRHGRQKMEVKDHFRSLSGMPSQVRERRWE